MNRQNYPEMNKLIKLLAKADIPFEVVAFPKLSTPREEDEDLGLQIFAPSMENPKVDAVCHWGTYGYDATPRLIEVMSVYKTDVDGWLTAEEALEYFKEIKEGE